MEKFILVCTEHRGVFAGYATQEAIDASEESRRIQLRHAKMAIRFGTTTGIAELAASGPTTASKIGAPADLIVHKITAVFIVTADAQAAWEKR